MDEQYINIAYACNEAYMEQTTVSMTSLLENKKTNTKIRIFFIDMGISEVANQKLRTLVESYGQLISIIKFESIAYGLKLGDTGRHIASVYAKIFFTRLKDIERILYIDSDTVILGDLKEFYDQKMDSFLCAGVMTLTTKGRTYINDVKDEDVIINDGVVLMNIEEWRNEHTTEKCLEFIDKNNGMPPTLSEGTINIVCRGKIKKVHPKYNLMSGLIDGDAATFSKISGRNFYSQDELDEAKSDPCIIHYLAGFYNRPWCRKCSHPKRKEYLKYRQKTEYRDKKLSENKLPKRIAIIGFLYHHLPVNVFMLLRNLFG